MCTVSSAQVEGELSVLSPCRGAYSKMKTLDRQWKEVQKYRILKWSMRFLSLHGTTYPGDPRFTPLLHPHF